MELASCHSSGAKNFEVACRFLETLCMSGHDHFVWDCEEVTLTDGMLTGQTFNSDTYTVWWKNSGVSASQETSVNLPSAWQCKAAHKSEDLGSHHRILLDSVMPPTLQPWSSTLTFPPIWSFERNYQWYKLQTNVDVIHTVRTWLHELENTW